MNFMNTKLPKRLPRCASRVMKAARRVHKSKNTTLKRGYEPILVNSMLDLLTNPSKERVREISAMIKVLGMTLRYLNQTPTFEKNR